MQDEKEKREERINIPEPTQEPAPTPTPESIPEPTPEPTQEPTPEAPELEIPDASEIIKSKYGIVEEKMQRPDPWPDPPTEDPEEKQD